MYLSVLIYILVSIRNDGIFHDVAFIWGIIEVNSKALLREYNVNANSFHSDNIPPYFLSFSFTYQFSHLIIATLIVIEIHFIFM